MSNILHQIHGLTRDIGFPVRRLLPAAAARTVGPFVFSIIWDRWNSMPAPPKAMCVRIRISAGHRDLPVLGRHDAP
jgi:hypothetical protein